MFHRLEQALIYVFPPIMDGERSAIMRQFIVLFMGAGGIVLLASALRNRGWDLADQVCARGTILCDNPSWVLAAIAVLLLVATVQTIVKT